jgi:glycerophosphoryl diester phosphodiesterase
VPTCWHEQLDALDAIALHVQADLLTPAQAAVVKQAGFGLLGYTVNEPAAARRLFAMGVDAVCTDRFDRIPAGFAGSN